MYILDKLSVELKIDYLDLFNKANEYNSVEKCNVRADIRLSEVFTDTEVEFLACFALEYLRQNKIDKPMGLGKTIERGIIRCFQCGEINSVSREDLING